jgi:hypothetical protein
VKEVLLGSARCFAVWPCKSVVEKSSAVLIPHEYARCMLTHIALDLCIDSEDMVQFAGNTP